MNRWRKSSFSNNNGCVEVTNVDDLIMIRDSKDGHGPALRFGRRELAALIVRISAGEGGQAG